MPSLAAMNDSLDPDPFDRFLLWLRGLLEALRAQVDRLIARIVLTVTPGTGV